MPLVTIGGAVLVFVACFIVPGVNFFTTPFAPLIAGFFAGLQTASTRTDGLKLGALLARS